MNTELFENMLQLSRFTVETEFLRRIFFTYANLHPSNRERILYKNLFLHTENAIKTKKKIKIYYRKQLIEVIPLAFERDKDNDYNYLKVKVNNEQILYEMKNIEFII